MSDYGQEVIYDCFGTVENMGVGGFLLSKNDALTARAIKDSGIPALATTDGEVKAYVSQIKVALGQ